MNNEDRQEASELTRRAGKQSRSAARLAAEPVLEEVQDAAEKIEGTVEETVRTARRVNPKVLQRMSNDTGQGFLALSVAIWAGSLAFGKLRSANARSSQILQK